MNNSDEAVTVSETEDKCMMEETGDFTPGQIEIWQHTYIRLFLFYTLNTTPLNNKVDVKEILRSSLNVEARENQYSI